MRILTITFFCALLLAGMPANDAMAQGKGHGKTKVKRGGGPPAWAPAHGYRAKTRHVFFKEYDVYYDLERSVYISLSGDRWIVSAEIPVRLKSINLSSAVQVEIDIDADDPQRYFSQHKR